MFLCSCVFALSISLLPPPLFWHCHHLQCTIICIRTASRKSILLKRLSHIPNIRISRLCPQSQFGIPSTVHIIYFILIRFFFTFYYNLVVVVVAAALLEVVDVAVFLLYYICCTFAYSPFLFILQLLSLQSIVDNDSSILFSCRFRINSVCTLYVIVVIVARSGKRAERKNHIVFSSKYLVLIVWKYTHRLEIGIKARRALEKRNEKQ